MVEATRSNGPRALLARDGPRGRARSRGRGRWLRSGPGLAGRSRAMARATWATSRAWAEPGPLVIVGELNTWVLPASRRKAVESAPGRYRRRSRFGSGRAAPLPGAARARRGSRPGGHGHVLHRFALHPPERVQGPDDLGRRHRGRSRCPRRSRNRVLGQTSWSQPTAAETLSVTTPSRYRSPCDGHRRMLAPVACPGRRRSGVLEEEPTVDVRIGVAEAPREIRDRVSDDTDGDKVVKQFEAALWASRGRG